MTPFSFLDRTITIVGILNVTPDSFSDAGLFAQLDRAVDHGRRMAAAGAHLIDVGGESTRPGATDPGLANELARVVPVIEALAELGIAASIDTRKPAVAEACLAAGAAVVNDVGGLRDPAMRSIIAAGKSPAVLMHMPHESLADTHDHRGYDDVVADVAGFLRRQAEQALADGVREVVIDPGLGFGKSIDDNVQLLRHLDALTSLGHPVLVGASRKRFVGALSGVPAAADRDAASIGIHLRAVDRGARALRVHDVPGHVQALATWFATGPEP